MTSQETGPAETPDGAEEGNDSRDLFYTTFLSALLDHQEWIGRVNRAIHLGEGADPDIVGDTSFRQTRFAQFLETVQPHLMPHVEAVRAALFEMHQDAQKLVEHASEGKFSAADYDTWLEAMKKFRTVAARLADHADDLSPSVDEHTRLYTREYMDQRLREQCDLARRASQPFCIGLSELDQYEEIERTHGFPVIKAVLREVARRFISAVRLYDNVFRFDDQKFMFIFPTTRLRDAIMVSERIRADVASQPVETPAGEISVTISVGVLEYGFGEVPEDLLKVVDVNLAHARNEGRNRVVS
ncbi:diguanylate cyclase domain-containing protein [Magnetospira sp. QH-2]|uniref:diguanylate cyclase domain-containing protein n=1 Tax=Magnetospira sp. (strain QH-2) TaxID=1288970 RepID=UPI0003E81319|nr:diguanylate cyclase [Magnetospira sp. QH-2]CCQ72219.1 Diguanylate cyclase (GGDEF domain) [Magnetospira sp. QH-2]